MGIGPQLFTQPARFGEPPGDERGPGVAPQIEAVQHTSRDGYDVLQRAAQLNPQGIRTRVHPEIAVRERLLSHFGSRRISRRRHHGGGPLPKYLPSKAGSGQRHYAASRNQFLQDVGHRVMGSGLQTLRDTHHRRSLVADGKRYLLPYRSDRMGRRGRHHHLCPRHHLANVLERLDPLLQPAIRQEHRVDAILPNGFDHLRLTGPEPHVVPVPDQHVGKSGSPAPGSDDGDTHSQACHPPWPNRGSVPLKSRRTLERWLKRMKTAMPTPV